MNFLITDKAIINLSEISHIEPFLAPVVGNHLSVVSPDKCRITLKNKETFIVNYTLEEIAQLIRARE